MADNKPAVLGGTAIKPVERHGFEAFKYFLHNPETGEYLTRTPKSWALITIFYIIYYAFLAAFWAAMLMIFFTTLNDQSPRWIGAESLIGTSPGVGMHPKQTDALIDSSMIQYNMQSKSDSDHIAGYGGWVERTKSFLDQYDASKGKDCSVSNRADGGITEFCKFKTSDLGTCSSGNYGFDEGKPCVFLKLNKIYGIDNDYYNDPADLPDEMPQELKDHIKTQADKNQVWIECHGEYPADRESLGKIEYFPKSRGIPQYYFPYMNQKGYQSPVVAVKFENAKKNQLLHVECRAWAKNIGYHKRDRIGINHMEIHILDDNSADEINKSLSWGRP